MEFISDLCGFLVSITILLGVPIGIIWLIVAIVKKSNKKIPRNVLLGCCVSIIVFTLIGSGVWSQTAEGRTSLSQKNENTEKESEMSEEEIETQKETQQEIVSKDEQENQQETNTESAIETNLEENPIDEGNTEVETETVAELTEEEYKAMCQELFYDEVFFGEDNLEGKYVKLHLFLSEKYYFTADAIYSDSHVQFVNKYNLKRDFFKCCVLHEDANSYVGRQIEMMFSDDYNLCPNNYETGQKLVVYAEVVSWSDNTWDGYNSVIVIPRYIEAEE